MTRASGIRAVLVNTDPWIPLDGRLSAPAGSPQFPTILNVYHPAGPADGRYRWPLTAAFDAVNGTYRQPQWMVCGVDYRTGIDATVTPQAAVTGGVLNAALVALGGSIQNTNEIHFGTANANIGSPTTGWDFSVSNGLYTVITDADHITFQNCKFGFGSSTPAGTRAMFNPSFANFICKMCEFDGASFNNTAGAAVTPGLTPGLHLFQHCYFHNVWAINIADGPPNSGTTSCILQCDFCVFKDMGIGFYANGSHCDFVQDAISSGTPPHMTDQRFNFCLIYISLSTINTQGLSLLTAGANIVFGDAATVDSCGFILQGSPVNPGGITFPDHGMWVNWPIIFDRHWLATSAPIKVTNNYFDLGGALGQGSNNYLFYGNFNSLGPPFGGVLTQSNNVNCRDGTLFTAFDS